MSDPISFDEAMKPAPGSSTTPAKGLSFEAAMRPDGESAPRGVGGLARDVAAWGLKGAIGLVEAPVGVADIVTGGRVGKALENEGGAFGFRPKQAREAVNDWHSEATKDAQRKFQEAEGIGGKFQAAIQNPSNIVGAVAESLPAIYGGSVLARGLMGATRLGQMGVKGATAAGAAGEGIMMAGSQAEAIRQETQDGLLTPAQAGIAAATGGIGGLIGGASGRLANNLGVGDADTMLAQGAKGLARQNADEAAAAAAAANPLGQQQAKSVPRQVIEGAITEGLLEELPQSVAEQLLQNLALDKPWSEGLDDAIVLGALSGGAMGAGAAGYRGLTRPTATGELGAAPAEPGAAPAPAGQPLLGLPAPAAQGAQEQPSIQVSVDGVARTQPYQTPGYVGAGQGDVTDVVPREPQAVPVKPSEAMGLNPNAGALSAAAVQAVDSGASDTLQAAAAQAQTAEQAARAPVPTKAQAEEIDLADIADPYERAYYESFFADAEDAQIGPEVQTWLQDDTNIPDLDAASSASDEDFLRALGANDQEITDAIASIASQPASAQEDAQSAFGTETNEPTDQGQGAGEAARAQGGQVDAGAPADAGAAVPAVGAAASDDAGRGATDSGAYAGETGGQPATTARAPGVGNAQAGDLGNAGRVAGDAPLNAPTSLKEGLSANRAKRDQEAESGRGLQAGQAAPAISQLGQPSGQPSQSSQDGAAPGSAGALARKDQPDLGSGEFDPGSRLSSPEKKKAGSLPSANDATKPADFQANQPQGAPNGPQADQAQQTEAKPAQEPGTTNNAPAAPAAPTSPKQAKAIERVNAGKAFFFSKQKADAFIADNSLTGTHAVEQEGRSFHVRAAAAASSAQGLSPTAAKSGEAARRLGQISAVLSSGGYVQGAELRSINGMAMMRLNDDELGGVPKEAFRSPPSPQQMQAAATAGANTPAKANADATMDAAPAPKPAPVKPSVKARIEAARQTRADHFAPGNIVKSYSGHDRVVSYNPPPKEGGNWSVTVQAVVKQGDAWVDAPNESQRTHSTQPGERELKVGPVEKAQAKAADAKAPASLVQAAKDNGKLEIVTVGDKKPAPEQKGIALAGWTPETGDQGNTIWTKTANSELYTATLDPAASTMEVTVLVGVVDSQIASFKVESSEQAARMASEAVARDVAEANAAKKESRPAAAKAQKKPAAADDLDAMFDDVLAEEVAKEVAKDAPAVQPKPTNLKEGIAQARAKKAAPAPRTATQAATSAAKNTASALGNAIDGLGALFGGAGKLGSGLSFDENTYAKAKPLFKQAVDNLGDAGSDLKEAMRAVIRMVMDKFGAQAAGNMKPYVVKFVQDMKDEQQSEDNNQESSNERPTIQGNGPKALDGMAPGKGEELEGDGQSGLDLDGGRDERTEPGAGTDGAGPQGARSGGGGTPGVRAPSTGGSRGGRKPERVKQDAAARAAENAIGPDTRPLVDGKPTSAPNIPAANFRITDETRLGQGSEQVKFNDNIAAIRTLQAIEQDNRRATPQEQNTLARYVGWGGLANAFPDPLSGEYKTGWEARGQELRGLLTDAEFSAARASTRNAHYTPRPVVEGMWRAATRLGFKGGLALETSMGTGNFLGLKPEGVPASFIGVEYDSLTARMAAALYPQSTVLHAGFQDVPLSDNAFTLSIGNPPYGQDSLRFQFKPEFNRASIHNQFFRASMDALRPGGLQVMVVSRYLMDAKDKSTRIALAQKARLVGAIRLPDVTFKENARTSVVTDIVILQKLTQAEQGMMEDAVEAVRTLSNKSTKLNFTERQSLEMRAARVPSWVEVSEIADPLGGEPMTVNNHFLENKANILGVLERSASSARGLEMTVRLDDAASLGRLLNAAVDRLPEGIQDFGAEILAGTEKRHKSMSDALRISLDRHEIGHVQTTRDGALERVIERDAPEGGMEMAMQTITAESPWSNELMQDGEGRWYRNEVVMDDAGKPVKAVRADGMPGRNNLVRRVTFENEGQVPDSLRLGATGFARLSSAVGLRDSVKRQIVMETEDAAGPAMEANRKELAKRYADFVTRFGPVNRAANLAMVMTMPDGGLVAALETSYQPEVTAARAKTSGLPISPEVAKPAPMLTGRVIPKFEPAAKASSGGDALAISLSETGRVDLERMAQLRGLTQDEVIAELQAGDKPLAFLDPEREAWETADAYLSGSVVRKLKAANAAMLDVNIKALEAVQPVPWGAEDVTAMLGSAWVPPRVYADFAEHLTGGKATVSFSPVSNTFTLKIEDQGKSGEWDSDGTSAAYILGQLLNSKAIVVKDGDKPPRVDKERTDLAQIKAGEISAEFLDWVFRDSERRAALVALFNEKFNTRVVRQRDGSHLQLPGKVPDSVIGLRRHQKNVIWRGITDNALLMDHAVGAGKTFAAIARAMERRRMGMSRKPMVVVPNHLVDQWATDVYRLYPGAKVLAAGKKDFEAKRRRRLFGRIATGDWDLVIVPHSSFGFIGIDPATEARFLQLEMDQALQGVKEAQEQADEDGFESQRTKPLGVKEAELLVKKIQARMDSLNSGAKDRLLTFEQMGVDDLTVDESHEFKNLYYSSRLTNTRGMGNKIGSRKANDLYNKIRVLQEVPTNSVSFLTGTPISNSAVEMFTVMRYLAPKQLKEMGLEHFDAWRAQFVEASAAFEHTEAGTLKEVTRLGRNWSNMRSLMDLYYEFTDAVSLEDIQKWYSEDNGGKAFPVPKIKGGKRQLIAVKPTPAQEQQLAEVLDGFNMLPFMDDPYERNAERLRLMDRARKVSLDARAVDPYVKSTEPGGKLAVVSENVKRIYDATSGDKGAQMVFLDRSVPKSRGDDKLVKEYDALLARRDAALSGGDIASFEAAQESLDRYESNEVAELRRAQTGGWNAYQQIKDNLVAAGIPANEIRFIQEASNDEQKQALFDAVNSGKVRVLLGSSQRMGAGTNAQKKLVALHHVDVTWKPSDIEQREGRIIRQGNELLGKYGEAFEVELLAYATERTVDAKMWDLNATKLKTINGIRKYDGAFTMEFEDADSIVMSEIAALASGNPLLLERVTVDTEITRLELQERAFRRRMYGIKDAVDTAEDIVQEGSARIEQARAKQGRAVAAIEAAAERKAERRVTIEGKEYETLAGAMAAAKNAIGAQQEESGKGRYSLSVNGKRLTTQESIDEAVSEALGDFELFDATIDGATIAQRTRAARVLTAQMNELTRGIGNEESRTKKAGSMLGFDLVLDAASYSIGKGSFQIDGAISLVNESGATVASEVLTKVQVNQSYVPANLRNQLSKLFDRIARDAGSDVTGYLKERLERAQRELPELRERLKQEFPKAGELKDKRARLRELVSLLEGKAPTVNAPAPSEPSEGAEDVRFSRSTKPGPTFSPAARMQAVQAVEKTANAIRNAWANGPQVVVAFDMQDPVVPESARRADLKQRSGGARGAPEGFYYRGKVYLIASKLNTVNDAARVLFHEALGHHGLRGAFGKEMDGVLNQVATMRRAQVDAKIKEYGLRGVNALDRRAAAEEVLAEMAQATPEIGFVKRAIAAIRNWLRANVPGFKSLDMTDADIIEAFILPARRFVEGGPRGPGGGVRIEPTMGAFSRATDQTQTDADEMLPAKNIRPLNLVEDKKKFEALVKGMARDGWTGRPVLVWKNGKKNQALTGSHRIAAARKVGIDVPVVFVSNDAAKWEDPNGMFTTFQDAIDDQRQSSFLDKAGDAKAANLMAQEDVDDDWQSVNQANPDIRFSRASASGVAARMGEAIKSVSMQSIKNQARYKKSDWLGLGLQALGRRQIVDIYGKDLPQLSSYNKLAAQMEADKNEVGAEADQLAQRWGKVKDEKALAELMHDATLAQIDPDKPYEDGDDKAKFTILSKRYKALTDEARQVYRDARAGYENHHAKVREAIKQRIMRSELTGGRRADLLNRMDDEFFKKTKGVYFPLARFGQYVVAVRGPDGKIASVNRAETMAEAQALRASLIQAFPPSSGHEVIRPTLSKEFIASRDAVGRGFMTELYGALDGVDMGAAERAELEDTLGQLYLSSLPDLSWAKHGIHRKGTPGFSQDARRAFAQNMFHGGRYLAKLRYSDLMQTEITDMQKMADDWKEAEDFDQPTAQRVVDEMQKRHESLMNPKSNPLSSALTSLGFVFFLGLSPASALVNLSQTALVAYPVMAAKWGFDKSATALLKASKQTAAGKNDITGSLTAEERAAYDEAVRAGTIDVTMAHDLAGIAQGEDSGVMWKIRPVMRWASFMFHHAERFNRQVTFIAAYRLAKDAGADAKAAFEQATEATYQGHFDYSSGNRPRVMQGNTAKVLLLFKQYGQNMVYTLGRSAQQAIQGETPAARREARRALSGLLVMHGLGAGALGLPLVTTLLAVASMIGGGEDEPWDAKVALQNTMADLFGQKPAEVMMHGLSRLTPWDISGRVGLDRLILPDVQEGLEGQRLAESAMTAALGPVAGIGVNILKGVQDMGNGQFGRGLEGMLPSAVRNGVKAIRYANDGAKDKSGIVIKDEVNPAEVIGQALGFSPSSVRNASEGKSAVLNLDRELGRRRSHLLTEFANARRDGNADAVKEAQQAIAKFNEKNPGRRITIPQMMASVRARQRRIDQAKDGLYLPKSRADARDAGRFAAEQ